MTLVVEDGSGVPGANSFATLQEAAPFHAERGGLVPSAELDVESAEFSASDGTLTAPAGTFAGIEFPVVARVEGAGNEANRGFFYLRSLATVEGVGDVVRLGWISPVNESPVGIVTVTVFDRSGWYAETSARMEAALINAAEYLGVRYAWGGIPTFDVQPLAWPRDAVFVYSGSPYYAEGYAVADDEIPVGVIRCQLWLALADLERPLREPIDPSAYLQSKSVGPGGVSKTFGGKIRRRLFPHADAEVAGLMDPAAAAAAGPFIPIARV